MIKKELCWRFAWQVGEDKYVSYKEAVKLYEEAYERHFEQYLEKLDYLKKC